MIFKEQTGFQMPKINPYHIYLEGPALDSVVTLGAFVGIIGLGVLSIIQLKRLREYAKEISIIDY